MSTCLRHLHKSICFQKLTKNKREPSLWITGNINMIRQCTNDLRAFTQLLYARKITRCNYTYQPSTILISLLILNAVKHNVSVSVKATNILTCNLIPLRGVVSVRARNGYRPRQVLASVFALLSK